MELELWKTHESKPFLCQKRCTCSQLILLYATFFGSPLKLVVEIGLKATNFEINILNVNNYIKASQRK